MALSDAKNKRLQDIMREHRRKRDKLMKKSIEQVFQNEKIKASG